MTCNLCLIFKKYLEKKKNIKENNFPIFDFIVKNVKENQI